MNDSGEPAAVSIARIEAQLDALRKQIDHADRNQAQLVRLFDERVASSLSGFNARFDEINRRLDLMERARDQARSEAQRDRDEIMRRIEQVEAAHDLRHDRLTERVGKLENFNAKLAGMAIVAAGLSSVATALVSRAIGG